MKMYNEGQNSTVKRGDYYVPFILNMFYMNINMKISVFFFFVFLFFIYFVVFFFFTARFNYLQL